MQRKYEVRVVVEVTDNDDDPDMEYFVVANAVFEASKVLTRRSEGFDDPEVVIDVREIEPIENA